ncbi:MAG: DNA alkylation repair protein, partial [Oscillospiraceae bacterium]
ACTGDEDTHEETMLRALVIARVALPFEEHCALVRQFLPSITDWALCDAFCADLKFLREQPADGFDFLCSFLQSARDYDLRFAVVGLLDHFTDEEHIDRLMACYGAVRHSDYYVKMAVAWAISASCVDFAPQVFALLESDTLDDFTRRKAVSKICDSLRVSEPDKKKARALRRV